MSNIEDDVKRCNELIKVEHANWIGISNQLAISHILAEREQMLKERDVANDSVIAHKFAVMQQQIIEKDKRIQELEEESRKKSIELICYQEELENSIPTQVVIEALEDIEDYFDRLNGPDEDIEYIRQVKKELLEGERK